MLTRNSCRAANLKGFRASMNPRFEGGVPDCMDGIPDILENVKYTGGILR